MKLRRIVCVVLILLLMISLLALPTQAATNPAFQWLVDFAKREGEYDTEAKVYSVAWTMDMLAPHYVAVQYDLGDGNLYCSLLFSSQITTLVLTPDLKTPYQVLGRNDDMYAAEYTVYPGNYTETVKLHFDQFYGSPGYQHSIEDQVNTDLPGLLESINNLFILSGTSYRLKDLGFTSFTRHGLHVYSEKELIGTFVCGGVNEYRWHCLICGEVWESSEWEGHILGDLVWVQEPTCTEGGYGYRICARCGKQVYPNSYEHYQKLGHDWKLTELLTPITEAAHVQGLFHCSRCGEEKTDEYCASNYFKDMPARDNWAHTPIDWAFAAGITAGTSATAFSPKQTCSRAQIVTFLWRAAGMPEPASEETPFRDVKQSDYFYKAVLWAVEKGITKGTSQTAFSPSQTCTRGQIVTFLYRYENAPAVKEATNPFTDVRETAYYLEPVLWAVENNITAGTSQTTFSPASGCTRAQVVTFLYRDSMLEHSTQPTAAPAPTAAPTPAPTPTAAPQTPAPTVVDGEPTPAVDPIAP